MGNYLYRASVLAMCIGAFLAFGAKRDAMAGVQVDVNIGLPFAFEFHAPPPVVVIPGTYVYLVPDVDVSVLFYHGGWYRSHGGRWFRARSYNGPWAPLAPRHVPRALTHLPPHYRNVPAGYHRIPHGQLEKNWGKWEREKHWNRDKAWRAGWKGRGGNGGAAYGHDRGRQGRANDGRGSEGHGGKKNPHQDRDRDKHGRFQDRG